MLTHDKLYCTSMLLSVKSDLLYFLVNPCLGPAVACCSFCKNQLALRIWKRPNEGTTNCQPRPLAQTSTGDLIRLAGFAFLWVVFNAQATKQWWCLAAHPLVWVTILWEACHQKLICYSKQIWAFRCRTRATLKVSKRAVLGAPKHFVETGSAGLRGRAASQSCFSAGETGPRTWGGLSCTSSSTVY